MNKHILKKIAAVAVVACTLGIAYYGTYLPFHKSTAFIQTLNNADNTRSFDAFTAAFGAVLDAPSPIGQEELVRNVGSNIVGFIHQDSTGLPLAEEAANFLNKYYDPIITRGRGMSFGQNLYLLGSINAEVLRKTATAKDVGDAERYALQVKYFNEAKKYYLQGLEASPTRPQFLFGLFDLYRLEGNVERVPQVANEILRNWPKYELVREALAKFLEGVGKQNSANK